MFKGYDGFDGFEAIVHVAELQCVGAHDLFIYLQTLDALKIEPMAPDFHMGAIVGQNDFLPGLHTDKFIGRAKNIE